MPFDWLIPIEEGLPELRVRGGRTYNYGSVEQETAAIAGIKTKWLAIIAEVKHLLVASPDAAY